MVYCIERSQSTWQEIVSSISNKKNKLKKKKFVQ